MELSMKQKEWLDHLAEHGPSRSKTVTGYFCRIHGLTEFVYRSELDGTLKSLRSFERPLTDEVMRGWDGSEGLERLTEAGRRAQEEKTDG